MDKIILDSMIRIPTHTLDWDFEQDLKRDLTLETPDGGAYGFSSGGGVVEAFHYEGKYLCVPRNYPGALELLRSRPFIDARSDGKPLKCRFTGKPRKGQQPFVDGIVRTLIDDDELGVIGQAPVGFGKTVVAAMVASRLGRSTLFLAHKEALCKQFIAAVERFCGVTPGWVQGDRCEYEGLDFAVGMLQSLNGRDYPEEFYDYFGLVIVDETHRASAPTFSAAISKMRSRWRLGLTATPRRGDKLENVFFWNIGEIGAVGRGDHLDCDVYRIRWNPRIPPKAYKFRGKANWGKLHTILAQQPGRNRMLAGRLINSARKGRKILALSKRVSQVETLQRMLAKAFEGSGLTVGYYEAGTTKKAKQSRETALECDVTLATNAMAAEGLDSPAKDMLYLLSPIADVEQATGRIRRLYPGKPRPVVVQIMDSVPEFTGIYKKSLRYFKTPGLDKGVWKVQDIHKFAS